MKQNKGKIQRIAKYCLSQIEGPRYYLGERLKGKNNNKVKSAQVLWLGIIAEIVSRRQKLRELTLVNFVTELNKCDVKAWLAAVDTADGLLLQSTCDAKGPNLKQWETAVLEAAGKAYCLMKSLLRLLRRELRGWFVDEDVSAFRILHQVFGFPLRLSLKLDDLTRTALSSWIDAEDNWQAMPGVNDPEKDIISEWFPKVDMDLLLKHFDPHHGPGSVLEFTEEVPPEQTSISCKYLQLQFDSFQREFISSHNLEERIGHKMMQSALPITSYDTYLWDYGNYGEAKYHNTPRYKSWTCEVVFVPKSWKTYRTISKETTTRMWLQQGVREAIDWYIKTGRTQIGDYYCPGQEETSRLLCEEGSVDGFYATLDLSFASDSNSWRLVQKWYADSSLDSLLYAVRTPLAYESYTDSTYRQSKFAPMGSAVCFPILSITMAAICESCRRQYFELHNLKPEENNSSWPWFRIVGDDIVCRSEIEAMVRQRLTELGWKVNVRKSYYRTDSKHYFRECCGVEFLDGQDVGIVKLPRPNFEGFMWTPSPRMSQEDCKPKNLKLLRVPGLVGLANNLGQAGWKVSRWMIVHHLLSDCGLPIVFSEDGKHGLVSSDANNRHLEHVWLDQYQRVFLRGWKVITLPRGTTRFSELRLDEARGIYCLKPVEVSGLTRKDDTWLYQANRYSATSFSDWTGSSQLFEWLRTHRRTHDNLLPDSESTLNMDKSKVSYLRYGFVDPECLGGCTDLSQDSVTEASPPGA